MQVDSSTHIFCTIKCNYTENWRIKQEINGADRNEQNK